MNGMLIMIKGTPKKGASKSIFYVIKHFNFQLYKVNPEGFIFKNLTIDDKFIKK